MKKEKKAFLIGFEHKKNKKIAIKDYILCDNFFSRVRGLMFRQHNFKKPLIFIFPAVSRVGIHSFFVFNKFLAIWLKKNKIVDVKIVKPWRSCVKPKNNFDCLIEIPFTNKKEISVFLDDSYKHLNT